jgi:hypothetical protein
MTQSYGQAAQDFFIIHMLKKKRNGYFLEIGSNHPIVINNTYQLERDYGWKGIMVEYDGSFLKEYQEHRPNSIPIINDARAIDYVDELRKANFPRNMDYLQIDLDVDNKSTLDVLLKLSNTVFHEYKFATVTFEHDIYRGDYFNTRTLSRAIFESHGYVRIFSDVMISLGHHGDVPFEDWYVHPALVDMDYVKRVTQEGAIHCQEMMRRFSEASNEYQNHKRCMLPVSEGEILDKLSILEIKQKEIQQTERRVEIEKELQLYESFFHLKHSFQIYYQLISFVNKRIWDLTDIMKKMDSNHSQYAPVSAIIFDYNQQRFRIKNMINKMANSSVKEQKSYASQTAYVNVFMESTSMIYDIIYCLLHYDNVEVHCQKVSDAFKHTIQSLFPTVSITNEEKPPTNIQAQEFETKQLYDYLQTQLKECLNPLFYLAGGKLGDFILQLSVVEQNYRKTGRKGVVYMYDNIPNLRYVPTFSNGLQGTYDDIYNLIIKQEYILDFKIWNNYYYDINLSKWYNSPLLYHTSWCNIFKSEYDVEWGKEKWIQTKQLDIYKELIVITPFARDITVNLIELLSKLDTSKMVFACFTQEQYKNFVKKFGLELPVILCKNIEDMAIVINSCALYIGCMSSPLALAQATHANTVALLDYGIDATHNMLHDVLPRYQVLR